MRMKARSNEKEWIDLGPAYYTPEEYKDCLKQLGRVGSLLGGDQATLSAFTSLDSPPASILDVGCGGGFLTKKLALKYPEAQVLGIDYSGEAVRCAKEWHQNAAQPNLSFAVPDTLALNFPENCFDVVTCTLVCHHMTDAELVEFLRRALFSARKCVIINDLHRHPLAYAGYALIAPPLFRNRLITHDGLLSIRKGFTKKEWQSILQRAGAAQQQSLISWKWAFRWIIRITL